VLAYVAFDALMLVGITFGPAPLRTVGLLLGPAVVPMPSERQLIRMLDDRSDWVRENAVLQIRMRGLRGTCGALVRHMGREVSSDVLVEMDEALSCCGTRAQVPALVTIALDRGGPGTASRYARHALAHLTRSQELRVFLEDDLIYDLGHGPNWPPPTDGERRAMIRKWWAAHRGEYENDGH
jgi:hypothetical protein